MARGDHVSDLFSAAYDGELTEEDAARFHAHLMLCSQCRGDHEAFRRAVDALRAEPRAQMPRPVHIPASHADEPALPRRRLHLRLPRLLPGATTAVAAIAAVVVLVMVSRSATTTPGKSLASPNAAGAAAAPAGCPTAVTAAAPAQLPAAFQHRVSASDPGRPGQELVVASSTGDVPAGSTVRVFAQLTAPRPSAASPGSQASLADVAAVPCLQVNAQRGPTKEGAQPEQSLPQVAIGDLSVSAKADAIASFTVPAGTPSGTVLHLVATVPPNYPFSGEPPLTVDLVIVVR